MSTLKVGGIRGVSASSDAITVANDGTCSANITSNGGGQLSNRNMIINGGMMINQRYGDAAHTPTDGIYTMDRWQAWMSTTGKFSVTRSDDHPDDFAKSLLVTSLSAATVTADHEHGITTKIEGYDMARLAFGTSSAKSATLSFYVKCSLTGTFGGLVANSALNMSYVFSYTVDSANTWERKTITIPPTTSGSFGTGTSNGVQVHFEFGVGSNRDAAVGWQTNTAVRGVNGQVNLIATNAATWRMTGLQLEVGTVATDFEHRSFGEELERCFRYFQKIPNNGALMGQVGRVNGTTVSDTNFNLTKVMRATPSCTVDTSGGTAFEYGSNAVGVSSVSVAGQSAENVFMRFSLSGSATNGHATYMQLSAGSFIKCAAEL